MQDLENLAYAPELPGLAWRGYSGPQDHERIAALIQCCWDADGVDELITTDNISQRFAHMQNFDPAQDILLAEVNGDLIGYARMNWVHRSNGEVIFMHQGCVSPSGGKRESDQPCCASPRTIWSGSLCVHRRIVHAPSRCSWPTPSATSRSF